MGEKLTALITGSNKGLGFQICRQLAQKDVTAILTARDANKGQQALDKLNKENIQAEFHQLDITDDKSIENIYDFILNKFGRLDILVNNAGIFLDEDKQGNVLELDMDCIRKTMETNLYGAIKVSRKFVPLMKKYNFGRIINMSSQLGQLLNMNKMYTAYKISKTALNAFTKILADELKDYNIQVNCMCPGWCRTDMGGWDADKSSEEGADTAVWLATRPDGFESGCFFQERKKIDW